MTETTQSGRALAGNGLPMIHRARDHSDMVVRAMVRAGHWVRVQRGCYVDASWIAGANGSGGASTDPGGHGEVRPAGTGGRAGGPPGTPAGRRRLALARIASVAATSGAGDGTVFTHTSAALIWGLPLWRAPSTVHVLARHSRGRDASRLTTAHVITLDPAHVVRYRGVFVTTLERTMLDVARVAPVTDSLVVADASLRRGADLAAALEVASACPGHRGIARAREVLGLADGGAESPWESFTRLHALAAGLPTPRLQIEVPTHCGTFRADMGWEAWRRLIEFDGEVKYRELANGDPTSVVLAEKRRQDAITERGWSLLRLTSADFRDIDQLHRRLRALAPDRSITLTPRPHLILR